MRHDPRRIRAILPLLASAALLAASPASSAGGLLGVEPVQVETVHELGDAPVALLLSKSVYPAEDGHLDAIVWLQGPGGAQPDGGLRISLRDEEGAALVREVIRPVQGEQVFFSLPFPSELAGRGGALRVEWGAGGRTLGLAEEAFSVLPDADPPRSGRVRLAVPNDAGAVLRGAPMTVGVPFPRGALYDERHVRLVDGQGVQVPLQTMVTGRWSRFGSVRWLRCDFVAGLDGDALELHLEYGPHIERAEGGAAWAGPAEGENFPRVEAGPLLIDESGVHFDAQGNGAYEKVMDAEALRGAFVEHENGKVFAMPADVRYRLEESGPEKAVVLREGWYVHAETGERFCKFVTRFVVHRGSPLLRVFHTWIFTGDAYEDRIANMGWRCPLAEGFEPAGFMSGFGDDGEWTGGAWLVHRDFEEYEVGGLGGVRTVEGRAAGVFSASNERARLTMGVRDFHQNYPRELAYEGGAMAFYEWPKRGRPPRHPDHSENPFRLWFAHEGEAMDLALPVEYTQEPIILEIASSRRHSASYTYEGVRQERANAQGIAKTAEMWLHFASAGEPPENAARVMAGLAEETLRAVVCPEWTTASGAFGQVCHRDEETFPHYERAYEKHALAPLRWAERLPVMGKWLWGTVATNPDLHNRYQRQHRAYRKSHHGWPYSWLPYARSGDARFLRLADAAMRFQTDVAFCHYSDERVRAPGEDRPRSRGWYTRDRIPWAHNRRMPTSRSREDKVHYLWEAYHMTGYHRARDVAMHYARLTREEGVGETGRWGCRLALDYEEDLWDARVVTTLLRTYIEMYQETFDPWFLAAAHRIARRVTDVNDTRNRWTYNSGLETFVSFTGDARMREFLLHMAREYTHQREAGRVGHWDGIGGTMIGRLAHAWRLTGEEFYARRLAGWLERAAAATFDGEPEHYQGVLVRAQSHSFGAFPTFTGYFLEHYPFAVAALAEAGPNVAPLPAAFWQSAADVTDAEKGEGYLHRMPAIALRKEAGEALPLALRVAARGRDDFGYLYRYEVVGPDGEAVLEGVLDAREGEKTAQIPKDAPAGVYRLRVEGESPQPLGSYFGGIPRLYVPVSPPGVPEVMELDEGEGMGPASVFAHYWFKVPEEMEEFAIDFHVPIFTSKDCPLVRFTVWAPDGSLAWIRQFSRYEEQPETVRAEVAVPPEQGGRLWQIALPHQRNARGKPAFKLDERIPGIFATSPDRWFDPR